MDPDAALLLIRDSISNLRNGDFSRDDVYAFIESVENLDRWISNKGFLPDDWDWADWVRHY